MKGTSPAGFVLSAVVAICLVLGAIRPGVAASKKPDITLKSKAATATVTLDARIKSNPKLAAYLLADGRKWANRGLAEANEQYKETPDLFSHDRTWELERDYTVQSVVANRYISVLRDEYSFAGGAHPNRGFDTFLWDDQAKKPISIRPFFTELQDNGPAMTAILKGVIASLVEEKKARDTYFPNDLTWQGYLEPKLLKIGPVVLAPSTEAGKSSGLEFHYGAYAVGAYAEGTYNAYVPWTVLKPFLSPEGVAIFGGKRPPRPEKSEE